MASSVPNVLAAIVHLGIVRRVATGPLVIARRANVLSVTGRPASRLESLAVRAVSQASPAARAVRPVAQLAVAQVAAARAVAALVGAAPRAERVDAR
jgi:hypothetical protein